MQGVEDDWAAIDAGANPFDVFSARSNSDQRMYNAYRTQVNVLVEALTGDLGPRGPQAPTGEGASKGEINEITFNITNYEEYYNGKLGGLYIELEYRDSGSGLTDFRFVQTVTTNCLPYEAESSPYNDPPNDDSPFYWNDSEMQLHSSPSGKNIYFIDIPTRYLEDSGVTWSAELSAVGKNKQGKYVPITTINYGFKILNCNIIIIPITYVQPSVYHLNSIP